jgi:ankyrin repeat protein
MLDRSVQAAMYQGQLHITYTPQNSANKPKLVLTIQNFNEKNDTHIQLSKLILRKCGGRIKDGKHRAQFTQKYKSGPIDFKVTISGYRSVEEAIHALLIHAAYEGISDPVHPNNNLNPYPDSFLTEQSLQQIKNQTNKQRKVIDRKKNKKILLKAKNINKYTAAKPASTRSANSVWQVKSISKSNKEKSHFLKINLSAITEIQSFNSRLFELLLGSEHVGTVKPVFDDAGIRFGTVSRGIEGFQSLYDYLDVFRKKNQPIDWNQFTELLIQKGYGKIDAANLIYADPDAHWDNVGFNQAGELVRIDFDRSLWPLICQYLGISPEEECFHDNIIPNESFPVNKIDLLSLPYLTYAKPHTGLVNEYTKRLPAYSNPQLPGITLHPSKEFLEKIQKHPKYINDKWYTCLKSLLIDNDLYNSLLDANISSGKRKKDIFLYLEERRDAFEKELLSTPEFCQYVIDNPDAIKNIIQEFNVLNSEYTSTIQAKYTMINSTILKTKKMIEAVTNGIVESEIEDFKHYLKMNPHIVNMKFTVREFTPLSLAIINGQLEIVQLLLVNGANPNSQNIDGCTALHVAATKSNPAITKALLQKGADPNLEDEIGWTPFYFAALEDPTKENLNVLAMLGETMELNQQDENGLTQLHIAASRGDTEVVDELLKAGANPNIATRTGLTAFSIAAQNGYSEIMKLLIKNSNFEKNKMATSPLYHAAYYGNNELVTLLLQVGADPNVKNEVGNTQLHIAASQDHFKVLNILLDAGADPDAKNKHDQMPLDFAIQNQHVKCAMKLLIEQFKYCIKTYQILEKETNPEILKNLLEFRKLLISVKKKLLIKNLNISDIVVIRDELKPVYDLLKKFINPRELTKPQCEFVNTTHGFFHQPPEAQVQRPPEKSATKKASIQNQKDKQKITVAIDELITKIFNEAKLRPKNAQEIFLRHAIDSIMYTSTISIDERIQNVIGVLSEFVHANQNAKQFLLDLEFLTEMCEDAGIKISTINVTPNMHA